MNFEQIIPYLTLENLTPLLLTLLYILYLKRFKYYAPSDSPYWDKTRANKRRGNSVIYPHGQAPDDPQAP